MPCWLICRAWSDAKVGPSPTTAFLDMLRPDDATFDTEAVPADWAVITVELWIIPRDYAVVKAIRASPPATRFVLRRFS